MFERSGFYWLKMLGRHGWTVGFYEEAVKSYPIVIVGYDDVFRREDVESAIFIGLVPRAEPVEITDEIIDGLLAMPRPPDDDYDDYDDFDWLDSEDDTQ